ncbi:MAG: hypothetical protein P8183_02160 [Anaerolineae bacterium]
MQKRSLLTILAVVLLVALWRGWRWLNDPRNQAYTTWSRGSQEERGALITVQREACPGAPFVLPADGFIGLLYADPRPPYSRFGLADIRELTFSAIRNRVLRRFTRLMTAT